jgi:glucuronokinase
LATATGSAPARAALAGNPSDGYGGHTLAVCLPGFAAHATVTEGGDGTGGAAQALVRAARTRFGRVTGLGDLEVGVDVRTSIPREVGLAGSSAIVIAVLRALGELTGHPLPRPELAAQALAAEVDELGIAAGPQDRIVQSFGGLVSMDFGADRHEELPRELLPPLFVAWLAGGGRASGLTHTDLRSRWNRGDAVVHDGVRELTRLGSGARGALLAGDMATFAACVDGSFDVRARMLPLHAAESRLVAIGRAHGAAVNYAGSGGAVVGLLPSDRPASALGRAYAGSGAGFAVVRD